MKRILGTALAIALSTAAFVVPAQAQAQVGFNIFIGNAPPPLRYEAVPAHRAGYEWTPGYWNWDRGQHVWAPGSWHTARPGQYYQRPAWSQANGGWHLNRGGWQQDNRHDNRNNDHANRRNGRGDRDRDGVPNRVDRDRDGDGTPNRFDSAPNNPRRD